LDCKSIDDKGFSKVSAVKDNLIVIGTNSGFIALWDLNQ